MDCRNLVPNTSARSGIASPAGAPMQTRRPAVRSSRVRRGPVIRCSAASARRPNASRRSACALHAATQQGWRQLVTATPTEPPLVRARVGQQRTAQATLNGIEALARQRDQILPARQPACGRAPMRAHAIERAAGGDRAGAGRACRVCSTSSPCFGTAHSAALVGVGARASATRSISVQSVSWPTAEMSGIALAAAARTTISSLKPHRSSRLPPPRATISTSGLGIAPPGCRRVEAPDRRCHLGRARLALHPYRPNQHAGRKPLGESRQHVADHGAGRRRDDADHARQEGQLAFLGRRRTDPRPRASSCAPRAAPSARRCPPAPARR